jgi:hypothetical protein
MGERVAHNNSKGSGARDRGTGKPTLPSAPVPSHPVLSLQQSLGNRAVQRLMQTASKPPKLSVETGPSAVQRDDDDSLLGGIGSWVSSAGSAVASGVGSAVDTVESGAKTVASDVGDIAGSAWQGAKSAAGDVADFGKGVYGQMREDADYVKKGEGWVDKGVDWLEDKGKGATDWVAQQAKGIPVLEQAAGMGKSFADTNIDVLGGAAKGVTGLAGGILGAAADPVDTARGLATMSEHLPGIGLPQKMLGGAYDLAFSDKSLGQVADETLDPMVDANYWGGVGKAFLSPYAQSIAEGKPGEALGRAGVDIGSLFLGAGEAGAAGKVGEISKVAEVADAAKVSEGADAAKIAEAAGAGKAASAGSKLGAAWDWVKGKVGGIFGGEAETPKPAPMSEEDQLADKFLKDQQKKGIAPTDEELRDVEWVPPEPGAGYGKPGPGEWKPNMDPDSLWKRRRGL